MRPPRLILASLLVVLSATLPAQQPPPTFRGRTTVVEVDVIARDHKGQFVGDLMAGDFEVLDDGVPQQISAIYRVIGPGEPSRLPSLPETPSLPAPPPQQIQRVVVIYFDQAHMQPGGFDRARKAALGFLQREFRQGDVGGIVNGSTMINNRLTSSREELEAAVQGIRAAPEGADLVRELRTWPRFVDVVEALRVTRNEPGYNPGPTVLDDVVTRACRDQPDDCPMAEVQAQAKAIQLVDQARLTGKQTLDTVAALSNGLARLPGRKTLILLSDGFFTEDTRADLRDVVGRAARASVRIYAIDTRGLNRGSAGGDLVSAAYPSQPEMSMTSAGDTNADGPNSLAVDTGGYVIRNENDFGKALNEIDRDTSSYYILGFHSTRPPDGKFHELKVTVKRSGVSIRARKGYVAYTDADAAKAGGPLSPEPGAAATPPAPSAPISPVRPLPGTSAGPGAAGTPTPPAATPPAAGAPVAATGAASAGAEAAPAAAIHLRPRSAEEISALEGGAVAPGDDSSMPAAMRKKASDGWKAYERGDVEKARTLLTDVAADKSAPPWTHYVLGWSQLALNEAGPAAANWEKVRSAVPTFEPVYFDLANAYQRQGDYSKAIGVLRDAQRRWLNDVEVYSAIGVIQLAHGAVDEAVATFTKGISVNERDANVCYNLARTYEIRYVRAERLRKVGPGSVSAASALEDRTRAIAYYQRVLALGGPLVERAKDGLKRLGQ